MKPLHRCLIAVIALLVAVILVTPASAAVTDWQKGASLYPAGPDDFGTEMTRQSLRDLANIHANFVSLTIPYHQTDIHSSDLQRGWNTPTDASLIAAIEAAHTLGLDVALNIHVESHDGLWRANINPADRTLWFTNYGNILNQYAELAQSHGVEQMTIGTELISLTAPVVDSRNTQFWRTLIANVRTRFSGTLTYSANHGGEGLIDEKNVMEFWPELDVIGISAYHSLSPDRFATVETMVNEWNRWNFTEIRPLSLRYNKPVIFTEAGYRSVVGAHIDPWNYGRSGCYDPGEQLRDYDALFTFWNTQPHMRGFFMWDWKTNQSAGGPDNTDFTPQRKPAEQLIAHWFGSGTPFIYIDPAAPPENCVIVLSNNSSSSVMISSVSSSMNSSSLSSSTTSSQSSTGNTSSQSSTGTSSSGGSSIDTGSSSSSGGPTGDSGTSSSDRGSSGPSGPGRRSEGSGNGGRSGGGTGSGGGSGGGSGSGGDGSGGIPPPGFGGGGNTIPTSFPPAGRTTDFSPNVIFPFVLLQMSVVLFLGVTTLRRR